MKILVVTTSYPIKYDGSEAAGSFVEDFVQTLGGVVSVAVVFPVNVKLANRQQQGDVSFYPFQVSKLPLSLLSSSKPTHWPAIISSLRAGQSAVNDAVVDFKPDHILALWALPSGYWAKNIDHPCIPYSIWALGSDIWSLGKVPVVKTFLKNVLNHARFRFADGYQLRDDVADISGMTAHFMPSTRILPVSKKNIRLSGPYNVAFLGRWHSNKGIDLLLDAMELLDDSDWEKIKCFRIAGGGPLESLVKSKSKALQKAGRPVEISGYLDTNSAMEFLMTADYLVIPSRVESIPVIFSDALQTSTPMVVTPIGDFPILFKDNPPGVITSNVTPHALLEAIKLIIDGPPIKYKKNISNKRRMFHMETIVDQFISKLSI
jgi:glycosyltransferase involved in cell wall biosynthesis